MTKSDLKARKKLVEDGYKRLEDMNPAPGSFTPVSLNGVTDVPRASFYLIKVGDELIPQSMVLGTPAT